LPAGVITASAGFPPTQQGDHVVSDRIGEFSHKRGLISSQELKELVDGSLEGLGLEEDDVTGVARIIVALAHRVNEAESELMAVTAMVEGKMTAWKERYGK
jgi:hypothetical protein